MKRIIKNTTPHRTYFTLQTRFLYLFWLTERNANDSIKEFKSVEDVEKFIEEDKNYSSIIFKYI